MNRKSLSPNGMEGNEDEKICRQAVTLELMISVSETLAGLVQDMLGPGGQQTLLSTHTGKVLVTQDGLTVLSSLHLAHPVAHCIMQSLRVYYSLHRDGSKTFVLYLSQILKAMKDHLQRFDGQDVSSRIKLSSELNQFLQTDFEQIAKLVLVKLKFCSKDKYSSEDFMFTVKCILKTSLHTCLQRQLVAFFTDFLIAFLALDTHQLADFEQYVSHILQYYDMYHTKITTQPQQKSRICQGILLEADLQTLSSTETGASTIKRFALVDISCDTDDRQRGGNVVSVQLSTSNLSDFFSYKRNHWSQILTTLKSAGVDVLLCADTVPQFIQNMCREKGIAFYILQHEKIMFLRDTTGVSVLEDLTQTVPERCVFTARIGSFILIGSKVCTLIELHENIHSCLPVNHMVVCAPTQGLCDQLCQSLYKALTAIRSCLKPYCPGFSSSDTVCGQELRDNENGTCVRDCDISGKKRTQTRTCQENKWGEFKPPFKSELTVGSGGMFEAILINAITDYYGTQGTYPKNRIAGLVQKMLTSIPQTLSVNLSSTKHEEKRQFTEKWTRILSLVHQDRLAGLGIRGDVCDSSKSEYIEPVSNKLSLVAHVLQLVVQLLRIESLIPVKKLPACDPGGSLQFENQKSFEFNSGDT